MTLISAYSRRAPVLAAALGLALFVAACPSTAGAQIPREVAVGLFLIDITNIDETRNTFDAEVDVHVSWLDPEQAFVPAAGEPAQHVLAGGAAVAAHEAMWTPQIVPTNPVGQFSLAGQKMVIQPDGRVDLTLRIFVTLRAVLDYRRFPFDHQVLPIAAESFAWNRDQVRLVVDEQRTGFDPFSALAEWRITGLDAVVGEAERVRDVVPFSGVTFNIAIERDSGFYVGKIFVTVMIIVFLTFVVFWMSGEGLGRRAGVSSGGILSVIAYQFVTTSSLPKVSYFTVADKMMLLSVVTIALTMVESLAIDGLTQSDPARKERIDRVCRVAFPAVYFLLLGALAVHNGVFG